jgi:hypothetical protein
MFTSSQYACDFCDKVHKGTNCLFDLEGGLTMRQVLKHMKFDRDFELVVQWNANSIANTKPLETPDFMQVNLGSATASLKQSSGSGISLYDCLSWFSTEETLTGNDKWFCSRCKIHVNARKKMELYRAPEFLIMHLKRFSH